MIGDPCILGASRPKLYAARVSHFRALTPGRTNPRIFAVSRLAGSRALAPPNDPERAAIEGCTPSWQVARLFAEPRYVVARTILVARRSSDVVRSLRIDWR